MALRAVKTFLEGGAAVDSGGFRSQYYSAIMERDKLADDIMSGGLIGRIAPARRLADYVTLEIEAYRNLDRMFSDVLEGKYEYADVAAPILNRLRGHRAVSIQGLVRDDNDSYLERFLISTSSLIGTTGADYSQAYSMGGNMSEIKVSNLIEKLRSIMPGILPDTDKRRVTLNIEIDAQSADDFVNLELKGVYSGTEMEAASALQRSIRAAREGGI